VTFELYQEVFRITEWRDGCVFRTEQVGHDWFPESVVKANRPRETNLIYCPPSDGTLLAIRKTGAAS